MTARALSAILRGMVEKSQTPAGGNGSAGSNGHAAENDANDEALRAELGASEDAEGVVDVPSGADDLAGELADVELSPAAPAPAVLDDATVERAVAVLLFAANEPLTAGRLASLIGGVDATRVEAALVACGERLRASGLPFDLRAIAGGWQLFTSTDQDAVVTRLARVKKDEKVSPASLETLSIIAYRQPVTKAEIEAIRGVQVGPILRALVDRAFVRVAGRAEVPGHPLLYGTTKKFLDTFGLASLEELPRDAELVRD
ncbi:MAG: SMC-Scp complex subunit ScpB [Planctomycetes bacterium]|nr:SMC-Scp complex subunit ScpB [Planctomycetota bacterium]